MEKYIANPIALESAQHKATRADKALNAAARFWFLVAVIGQWIFAFYIASFYGSSAVQGDFEVWKEVLSHGIIPGDTLGNFAIASHLLLAFIITVGGPLQLIPQLRIWGPTFHRWNGRLYMLTAFMISIGGLYMIWTRGTVGGIALHVGISLNGVLIMICAFLALRYAIARDIVTHRRWALRLFLVVSGVWFFRVGFVLSMMVINILGFDSEMIMDSLMGFWGFAQYLLPLAILELYLRTKDGANATSRFAMAACLFVLTIAMGVGIFAATMGMWLPHI
jgi:Predicted membrane protein (DUF2306)